MNLTRFVRNSFNETLRIELATALSAGAAAAVVTLFVRLFFRLQHNQVPIASHIRYFLLGFAAYALAASILYQFWTGWLGRIIPRWLLMPVLGSFIFVVLQLTPGIIGGWLDKLESHSLGDYISTEISAASSVFILLTIVTVPVAAAVYYSFSIAKALRLRKS